MTGFESPSPVRIGTRKYPLQLREAVVQFELAFLAKALDRHDGNISRTAVSLGVARRTLQIKIKRCGLGVMRNGGVVEQLTLNEVECTCQGDPNIPQMDATLVGAEIKQHNSNTLFVGREQYAVSDACS